jgi:F-type H+-transporting ATPase subunit beta
MVRQVDHERKFISISLVTRPVQDALDSCERILNDEFKDVPENALYMIGKIDEVKR